MENRDRDGRLDLDVMLAEHRAFDKSKEVIHDKYHQRRALRRFQYWPEYLIDKELAQMRAVDEARATKMREAALRNTAGKLKSIRRAKSK